MNNYNTGDYFENERFIPMQYTGLKDKNEKEIFEGDIVKGRYDMQEDHYSIEMVVTYDVKICGFLPFADYDSDCENYFKTGDCEVIGNIYEHPELLTK